MNEEIIKRQDDELIPEVSNMMKIAEGLAKSKMFPSINNKDEALAVIEYGRELRLPPVISLQTIVPIKGRLCVESKVYQALLERDGVTIKVLEKTKEVCKLEFKKIRKDAYTETFTIEDAKRAGLAGKQNFINYPETMLYYRCMSKGAKVYSPGSCLGLYTSDEMEEVIDKKRTVKAKPKTEAKEGKITSKEEFAEKVVEKYHEAEAQRQREAFEAKVAISDSVIDESEVHTESVEHGVIPGDDKPKKKAKPRQKATEKVMEEAIEEMNEITKEAIDVKEPEVTESEATEDPSKATSQEMAETIQDDFQIRFGKNKWREKYKEFKQFLLDFQKTTKEPRKFVNTNEHGRLSIGLGIAEDLILLWKNLPYTLLEWGLWQKERKAKLEKLEGGDIPF